MRFSSIAGLLGSAALSIPAAAQTQGQQPAQAAPTAQQRTSQEPTACARLVSELRDMSIDDRPITLRQARAHQRAGNQAQCQRSLDRVEQTAQTGETASGQAGSRTGARTTASTGADDSGARIVVRQPPPQVTLQRGQPEIRIQQQQPTITVEMPPPKVTVRMPQPDVNVASSQQGRADVTVSGQAEPRVRFERAQPRIVVRQSREQPQVTVQREAADQQQPQQAQSRQTAQAQTRQAQSQQSDQDEASAQSATRTAAQSAKSSAAATPSARPIEVSRLLEMSVYDTAGQLLGDVERVVRNSRGELAVVIGHGGLLGMGEKQIRVPLQQAYMQGDRLIARGMTEESLDNMPEWSEPAGIVDVPEGQSVRVIVSDA